jgi:hypothetical protein
MSIVDELDRLGERLVASPLRTPSSVDVLRRRVRRRQSRRLAAIAVGVSTSVIVAVGAVVALRAPQQVVVVTGEPVIDTDRASAAGLSAGPAVWPKDPSRFSSAHDVTEGFAREVLGWQDPSVDADVAVTGPTWLWVSQEGAGPERLRVLAVPSGDGWALMQVGESGLSLTEGMTVRFTVPDGVVRASGGVVLVRHVDGAAAIPLSDDDLRAGSRDLPPEIRRQDVLSVVVLFRDAGGETIAARGSSFASPPAVEASPPPPNRR